ncbi:hypothetical protein ALI144C_28280 [Actinosynnema sp. ALI-1.44]|uniref:DUF2537 domain-containing protein n=1 Tax=Actinosynnema sp. ALI-1.44 TaxID=1933779 RepID=UPI00097CA9C6|nr:DUF2537 domain-containing protein [Actinosynnema sp. ALI-1.44]ONI78990.1 hypothetical protein ALI144C_28280 [Actinosynnema sp. ALI-1.44]
MELRTNGERAELVAPDEGVVDPRVLDVPDDLIISLTEWAQVVAAMQRTDAPEDASAAVLVSRRGMQLADRLSSVLETPVRYHDPLTGEVLFVDAAPAPQRQTPQPEPTPWLTGLTVSALLAVVTLSAVLTLAITLSDTSALLALGANVVVTAGLAPSIWLARRVLIWRWVALGVAAGLALGWVAMVFVLL